MRRGLVIGVVVAALLLIGLVWELATTVDGNSVEAMARCIEKQQGIPSVQVLNTNKTDRFLCVLYDGHAHSPALFIWESSLLPGRYRSVGGGHTTEAIGTYNFNQSGRWSLIVVYGDNTQLNAASYTFINHASTYGRDGLEPLFLDVYVLPNTPDAASPGTLFDAAGNAIGSL